MTHVTDISGFAPTNGDQFFIDGQPYWVQNGNQPWSVANPDPHTLRFEIRSGDQWQYDPSFKERSEVSGGTLYAAGKNITIHFEFMVEPGEPNTADWLTIGQLHAADNFSSPIFAVELVGERIAIHLRYKLPGKKYKEWFAFVDDTDIIRGKYYHVEAAVNTHIDKDGYVKVWMDGKQIVDYEGPAGYGYGVYWKQGIYRAETDETIAVNVRDHYVEGDVGVRIVGTPHRDTIEPGKSLPANPRQTKQGDVIDALGGPDKVKGGVGHDLILGGEGNDILRGGRNDDTLVGDGGRDRLKGGEGRDLFWFDAISGRDLVQDFTPGTDLIALPSDSFSDHKAIEAATYRHQTGTLILFGETSILLKHLLPKELGSDDFLLV